MVEFCALINGAHRKIKHPFFSDGSYIAAPATSQSPDCLVEIAFFALDGALELGLSNDLLVMSLQQRANGRSLNPWRRAGTSHRGGGRLSNN